MSVFWMPVLRLRRRESISVAELEMNAARWAAVGERLDAWAAELEEPAEACS